MLTDFLRLSDYVCVSSSASLTIDTMDGCYQELLKSRKAVLFETTVMFDEDGTVFSPTEDEIIETLRSMATAIVQTSRSVNRIIYVRHFHEYVDGMINDIPNIEEIITTNIKFKVREFIPDMKPLTTPYVEIGVGDSFKNSRRF